MDKDLMIYVHIPFCDSKCIYCDFASFVCPDETKNRYFYKLVADICTSEHKDRRVSSIYFGGGTPSSVSPKQIERVLGAIKSTFVIDKAAEISIECNPMSNSLEKLREYRKIGINRISFGVQSLSSKVLKFLNRKHTPSQAKRAILDAKKAGFENISADLIIGVNSSRRAYVSDAKKLLRYGITHLSAYMLQIEPGTPLFQMRERGDKRLEKYLQESDTCVESYNGLVRFLQKRGFLQYEISNFCKKGFECRHNLGYWRLREYLGFGLAAHSYIDGKRIANPRTFEDYFQNKGVMIETLSTSQKIEEIIMLGLRSVVGIDLAALQKYGYNLRENKYFDLYLSKNILRLDNSGIVTLNPSFYGVSNQIIVNLLPN